LEDICFNSTVQLKPTNLVTNKQKGTTYDFMCEFEQSRCPVVFSEDVNESFLASRLVVKRNEHVVTANLDVCDVNVRVWRVVENNGGADVADVNNVDVGKTCKTS